jgi:sialate O-acetylesterase
MNLLLRIASFSLLFLLTPTTLLADVSLNNLFSNHMVLQQGIQNKVWGKADPG